MNLKATLTLTCCIIASALHAQKTNLEFLGGPNISMMYGNWVFSDETSPKIGLTTGIGLSYQLKEHLSLSVRGLFERKGCTGKFILYNYDGTAINYGTNYNFRFISNYITLPVTLQFTRGNRIKYTGEFGIFAGALIKGTYKTKEVGGTNFEKTDVTKNFNPLDAGLSVGFRTSFPLTKKLNLNVIMLDNLGLLNTSKGGTVRTNALNILTGVSFPL